MDTFQFKQKLASFYEILISVYRPLLIGMILGLIGYFFIFDMIISIITFITGIIFILIGIAYLFSEEPHNKISRVFRELKRDGCINRNRHLRASRFALNFRAGIVLFRNTIFYNKKYESRYFQLNENELKFILLHEEGHYQRIQCGIIGFLIFLGLLVSINLYLILNQTKIPGIDKDVLSNALSLFNFLIFLMCIKILSPVFHFDEFNSDEFAADTMKRNYRIQNPSKIIHSTLEKLSEIHKSEFGYSEAIGKIFFDFHPSIMDRVINIERKFE